MAPICVTVNVENFKSEYSIRYRSQFKASNVICSGIFVTLHFVVLPFLIEPLRIAILQHLLRVLSLLRTFRTLKNTVAGELVFDTLQMFGVF